MSVTEATTLRELPLRAGKWAFDPTHSSVLFAIRHLGLAKVRGRFDRFDVILDVGPTLTETRVEAVIDLDSIDTNNADRDAHLRGTDFFSTERHPTMHFVSTRISSADDELQLSGRLTLNGITQPITLDVEYHGVQEFPGLNKRHVGFSATGALRRSEFGIEFGLLPIGMNTLALGGRNQDRARLGVRRAAGGQCDRGRAMSDPDASAKQVSPRQCQLPHSRFGCAVIHR